MYAFSNFYVESLININVCLCYKVPSIKVYIYIGIYILMLDRTTVCLSYFNPCPYVCPSSFPPIRITFIQQPKRLIISSLSVCLSLCPSAHPHVYPYIYKRSYHAENVLFAQTHFNLFYILSSMPKHAKNAKKKLYIPQTYGQQKY